MQGWLTREKGKAYPLLDPCPNALLPLASASSKQGVAQEQGDR